MMIKWVLLVMLVVWASSQCSEQCELCHVQIGGCHVCKEGYIRNFMSECVEEPTANCQLTDMEGNCFYCQELHTLKEGACIKDVRGCTRTGIDGIQCEQCLFGTRLIEQSCQGVLNCYKYSSEGVCETCAEDYQLQDNLCVDFSAGCQNVNSANGACLQCKPQYHMKGYSCIHDDHIVKYCSFYHTLDGNTKCFRCIPGFVYNSDANTCRSSFDIADDQTSNQEEDDAFSAGGDTNMIDDGSFSGDGGFEGSGTTPTTTTTTTTTTTPTLNTNDNNNDFSFGGTGSPTIANCKTYMGERCSVCIDGYHLVEGACKREVPGCIAYDLTGVCEICSKYYRKSSTNLCVDVNCAKYDAVTGYCEECTPGFNKDEDIGACVDNGCMEVKEGACTQCKDGFYLPDTQTVCRPNPDGCRVMAPNSVCSECFPGYTELGGFCIYSASIQIPGCINQQEDLCLQCQPGRFLANNQNCINIYCMTANQEPCESCVPGYQKNENNVCVDPFCAQYNKHLCVGCQEGYGLNIAGMCGALPPNCLALNENNQCSQCANGFELTSANSCTQIAEIPNCLQIDGSKCLICNERFYLSSTRQQCLAVPNLCQDYNPETGFCYSCKFGILPLLEEGKCEDTNCVEYASDNNCIKCKSLYEINPQNGICENKDPFCSEIFNYKCNSCQSGYYLNSFDYCIVLPVGCSIANYATGDCLECKEGYRISNGACEEVIVIPNCERVDSADPTNCQFCSLGYYKDGKVCAQVSELCRGDSYNPTNGHCLACVDGYSLDRVSGKCRDPFCKVFDGDTCSQCQDKYILPPGGLACLYVDPNCQTLGANVCKVCAPGYYINIFSTCTVLPPNCAQASLTGACMQCNPSYKLTNSNCVEEMVEKVQNCFLQQGTICLQCDNRYYLSANTCNRVSDTCKTYNLLTGECWSCFDDYKLMAGACQKQVVEVINRDPNCLNFANGRCVECSNRFYWKTDRCIPVNPLCRTYNATGACVTCYPSYVIQGTKCILAPPQDPKCKVTRTDGYCDICFTGYYVKSGVCERVNPLCKTHDAATGACLTCYKGYAIRGSTCVIFFQDPNCKNFDNAGNCMECVAKHFIKSGKCAPVNPLCKEFNPLTGACTACYTGYSISGTTCIVGGAYLEQPNCKRFNGDTCLECYQRYYLNERSLCMQVNPQCRDYNPMNGNCTDCYPGYVLRDGDCDIPDPETIDGNCKTFASSEKKVCVQCYQGFFPLNGVCELQDDQCASYSSEYVCQGCYPGYALTTTNKCVIQSQLISDPNCIEVMNDKCTLCADGYFLYPGGQCQLADPQCQNYNEYGLCIVCYPGYIISDGKCINPATSINHVAFCELYDVMGFCSKCLERYYLKDRQCHTVSILCGNYNIYTGQCLTCNSEYFNLQNGECVQLNSIVEGCSRYQGPFCAQCQTGYYYSLYNCVKVSDNCLQFDYDRNVCAACKDGLTPVGSQCV